MTLFRTTLLAVPLLACLSLSTLATTYYVATNGSDSNSCSQAKSISTPKRNIIGTSGGLACLSAGDRLEIRAGNYAEIIRSSLQTIPSGSSWTYATTIAAYGSETVTIQGINLYSSVQYLIFERLIMDANQSTLEAVMIGNGAHHIRFQDCEAKNSRGQGGVVWSLGSGANEWFRGRIHHNGDNPGLDHGIYIVSANNILDGVEIDNNFAFGVHIYNGKAGGANGNVVKNCKIHHNGTGGITNSPAGVLITDASSGLVFNNLIYDEYVGVSIATPWSKASNIKVLNNTIYSCITTGLWVHSGSTSASVKNNILYFNGFGKIINSGISSTMSNNLEEINPLFVNPGAADFRLQSSSPAVNKGVSTAPEVTTDIIGNVRPNGSAYDIGAHEFSGTGSTSTGSTGSTTPTGSTGSTTATGSTGSTTTGSTGSTTTKSTYYVAANGSDSNSCAQAKSISSPKRNIMGVNSGLACLSVGDRLEIRAGTYTETIRSQTQNIPLGYSWAEATTIAAYGSEAVTVRGINLYSPVQYLTFERLIIDANRQSGLEAVVVGNGANHVRFVDCVARNSTVTGVNWYLGSGSGAIEWIRGRIHNNGSVAGSHHGINISSPSNILDGVEIDSNNSSGVQIYGGGGGGANGNVIKNCKIHNNATGGMTNNPAAIMITDAAGGTLFNNLIYDDYIGINVATPWTSASNIKVFNNTIYSCTAIGLTIQSRSTYAQVKDNIVYLNGTDKILNYGSSTTLSNNLEGVNPLFVNAVAADFHLQSVSPAIDRGTSTAPDVTVDINGNPRPSGLAYDIGAYEYK